MPANICPRMFMDATEARKLWSKHIESGYLMWDGCEMNFPISDLYRGKI